MTAHLWPIELFEAFYGVLWKAVSKKDPKWARRFHAALMEQVMGSAGSADEIVERLAGFDYAQKAGRPKGSGDVIPPAPLLRLYDPLLDRSNCAARGRSGTLPRRWPRSSASGPSGDSGPDSPHRASMLSRPRA
jgi:hypothetical protein